MNKSFFIFLSLISFNFLNNSCSESSNHEMINKFESQMSDTNIIKDLLDNSYFFYAYINLHMKYLKSDDEKEAFIKDIVDKMKSEVDYKKSRIEELLRSPNLFFIKAYLSKLIPIFLFPILSYKLSNYFKDNNLMLGASSIAVSLCCGYLLGKLGLLGFDSFI